MGFGWVLVFGVCGEPALQRKSEGESKKKGGKEKKAGR